MRLADVETKEIAHGEFTDEGNARRFVGQFCDRLRYVPATGRWLVWDGMRWADDRSLSVHTMATECVESMVYDAQATRNKTRRAALLKWAAKSMERRRLVNLVELAKPKLAVLPEQLDAAPFALNCINGVVNLRTGKLAEHGPEQLHTKLAPVLWQPDAGCPRFLKFLNEIFAGDADLIGYVQRLVGVCLTGDITEQVFPVLHGEGANGKSVLCDLIAWLIGDYCGQAPESLVTVSQGQEHPTEIADLQGRRLVIATETEQGKKLRVGLVKKMTGDAKLKGRYMRQDFFEFDRTHKTWLVTNHKPEVSETKNAIWRRMHLIPFRVTIPPERQDKRLLDKLRAEGPGVLAWAVRGCMDWQRGGLNPPRAVLAATEDYRLESDPLGDFLADCCFAGPHAEVSRKRVAEAYAAWCRDVSERGGLNRQGLYERLRDHADVSECWMNENGKRVRGFHGVSVVLSPGAGR